MQLALQISKGRQKNVLLQQTKEQKTKLPMPLDG